MELPQQTQYMRVRGCTGRRYPSTAAWQNLKMTRNTEGKGNISVTEDKRVGI
jgi:hypothetical protein